MVNTTNVAMKPKDFLNESRLFENNSPPFQTQQLLITKSHPKIHDNPTGIPHASAIICTTFSSIWRVCYRVTRPLFLNDLQFKSEILSIEAQLAKVFQTMDHAAITPSLAGSPPGRTSGKRRTKHCNRSRNHSNFIQLISKEIGERRSRQTISEEKCQRAGCGSLPLITHWLPTDSPCKGSFS